MVSDLGNMDYVYSSPRFPSLGARESAIEWLVAHMSSDEVLLFQRLGLTPSGFDDLGKVTESLCACRDLALDDIVKVVKLVKQFGLIRNGMKGRGKRAFKKEACGYPEFHDARRHTLLSSGNFRHDIIVAREIQKQIISYHQGWWWLTEPRYSPAKIVQLLLFTVQQFGW